MGSEVVFEMYKRGESTTVPRDRKKTSIEARGTQTRGIADNSGKYFIRVLFGGKPLKSSNPSLGLLDMVPAEVLLAYCLKSSAV